MDKIEIFCSVILMLVVIGILIMLFVVANEQDRKMFREELIWYSRYQAVEEMYLNDVPDNTIMEVLLSEVGGDWTEKEIRRDLEIMKTY